MRAKSKNIKTKHSVIGVLPHVFLVTMFLFGSADAEAESFGYAGVGVVSSKWSDEVAQFSKDSRSSAPGYTVKYFFSDYSVGVGFTMWNTTLEFDNLDIDENLEEEYRFKSLDVMLGNMDSHNAYYLVLGVSDTERETSGGDDFVLKGFNTEDDGSTMNYGVGATVSGTDSSIAFNIEYRRVASSGDGKFDHLLVGLGIKF